MSSQFLHLFCIFLHFSHFFDSFTAQCLPLYSMSGKRRACLPRFGKVSLYAFARRCRLMQKAPPRQSFVSVGAVNIV